VRYPLAEFTRDVGYDAADRISAYTHYETAFGSQTPAALALNQSFGYDELGRVTGITTTVGNWAIGYDANGNRTYVNMSGNLRSYDVAANSNRLLSVTNPAKPYGYDNAGNVTSLDTAVASYDLSGRWATAAAGGGTTTFTYNALGQRVRKFSSTGAASATLFVYDQQGQLLGEYDHAGNAIREYVWLGSTPVAMFTPDPASSSNPPLAYFIHTDHIATPRVVTDQSNTVRWRWMSEPFGTDLPNENPSGLGTFAMPLRFPGQYADSNTGPFYNYFRDYDPWAGRYLQSDPIGLDGGLNTYLYVKGNPLSNVDPDGQLSLGPRDWSYAPGRVFRPTLLSPSAPASCGIVSGIKDKAESAVCDGKEGQAKCECEHRVRLVTCGTSIACRFDSKGKLEHCMGVEMFEETTK